MESGCIVEYIDRQKIMCAVVLEVKNQRLRLLTENNREVNLSRKRLLHKDKIRLDLTLRRDQMVEALKQVVRKREELINNIDIRDLWEVLNAEQNWIDLPTMTEFCFPESPSGDHEAAVMRAIFNDRLYFKFNPDGFRPNSEKQVELLAAQRKQEERKRRLIETGGSWLKNMLNFAGSVDSSNDGLDFQECSDILKSYYLFGKDSKDYAIAKAMVAKADIKSDQEIFRILVKLGVFAENENVELLRCQIKADFNENVLNRAAQIVSSNPIGSAAAERRDLSHLPLLTIDGQGTLDFDDAISIAERGGTWQLGVHIADVGHFISKGDVVDQEALGRGSSIYMPDQKISMLPSVLAEGLCSLKAGELRPAISVMIDLNPQAEVVRYEILQSLIKVRHQLSYYDVNTYADENRQIRILNDIAQKFRQKRLDNGAVQITVPEISIWVSENQEVTVNKVNRESPGRMLVSELMIMANWLMAKYLQARQLPAIFRSQREPRERLYKNGVGTLFQNWMQRRLLSRFLLNAKPDSHSGLGLDAYITATSPIRKYSDLVNQRQIRAALGLETAYSAEQITEIIKSLELPMSYVGRFQYTRHRYWLLKFLENQIGQKEEAIVLHRARRHYQILLTQYMLECDLPLSSGIELKPEDLIQVTIQRVSARQDVIQVAIG
ncbi:MAG: ribonuclease catalytic domain-containing protein [Desulfobacterales bacterium]|jgi:exoribonuclease-2|nr:RNB domain-containing ribonuclease [Deltaproteobacteria bacterium]